MWELVYLISRHSSAGKPFWDLGWLPHAVIQYVTAMAMNPGSQFPGQPVRRAPVYELYGPAKNVEVSPWKQARGLMFFVAHACEVQESTGSSVGRRHKR